jgi:hypothetical protein
LTLFNASFIFSGEAGKLLILIPTASCIAFKIAGVIGWLFSSIQTGVPVPSGQAFPKYPDTVPAVSGQRSYLIRPKAGTSCMECNIDY